MKHAIETLESIARERRSLLASSQDSDTAEIHRRKLLDLEQAIAVLKEAMTPSVGENRPLTKTSGLSFYEALEAVKQGKTLARSNGGSPLMAEGGRAIWVSDMIATDWQIVG
jgi:hypothetical protein